MDTPEEARVEERSSHFTRELGRAVTFLSRSRKRFMNSCTWKAPSRMQICA